MKTVQHLLNNKSAVIYSVTKNTSVLEALEIMMEKDISSLLIIENGKLQGIFTERDYARKIILKERSSKNTHIDEVMTSKLYLVKPDDSIDRCMQVMTEHHIRHLPVLDKNQKVVGVISIGDLLKFIIQDQKRIIEQMGGYINS
ncbi:MAG TPA: CBS domain-containing protein [Daejeonella sp.]|nr:CBS domain-containing protein [Daejeonella sp.]